MNIARTTPPGPLDVTALFPQLAPLARTATRLHPCPGAPSARDSSVGGPLLWPAAEPWPHCEGPHELDGVNPALSPADLRLERRIRAAAQGRDLTPQERETLTRIRPPRTYPRPRPSRQPYDGSMAMLPLAQLYMRDVPDLRAPAGILLGQSVRRARLESRRLGPLGLHRPQAPVLPRLRHHVGPAADRPHLRMG